MRTRSLWITVSIALGIVLAACGNGSAQTVFRYSFFVDTQLPDIYDEGPAGNDAVAGPLALISEDIPDVGVPDDAGDASLDCGTQPGTQATQSGAVTTAALLLSNAEIVAAGGFTYECWFKWFGGGSYNAIIDYAGTEKIVLQELDPAGGIGRILEMRFDVTDGGYGDLPIGLVEPDEWHYVAVVFDTEGADLNLDGSVTGAVTTYLDRLIPVDTVPGVTKAAYGDNLARPIGIGQHPIGYDADFFDGLVFEPRVTLGPLAADELLFEAPLPDTPSPLFRYSFAAGMTLPDVPDVSGAGNDGLAGAGAALSSDIPTATRPDAGDRSLDAGAGAGVVTKAARLLSNAAIEAVGGFTMEAWFQWNGAGEENAIIDYAGTERIVIEEKDEVGGHVEMVFNDGDRIPVGIAVPGRWHYVAVKFNTAGNVRAGDGSIEGSAVTYFDSLTPSAGVPVVKEAAGDDANAPIGVGQDPSGAAASIFDGLIFEPKVSIGAIATADLTWIHQPAIAQTLFRYSFTFDMPLPQVPDAGPEGNFGTAGDLALWSEEIPDFGVPDDAGEVSLDSGTNMAAGDSGITMANPLLLSNERIAETGGFTYECWFKWSGAGSVNSIIDYAGTEKLILEEADPAGGIGRILEMRFDSGYGDLAIGVVEPDEWHYVAVVFDTEGAGVNADRSITGMVTVYLDGLDPIGETFGVTKAFFGDSLNRGIGVGKHPLGFTLDFFDGLVFEPRVSLGPVAEDDLLFQEGPGPGPRFIRGDVNADGLMTIGDPIALLNYQFASGAEPPCLDAGDIDDNGVFTIGDAVTLLNYQFASGIPPAPPGPFACGVDPTDDALGCASFEPCGTR
ncbi:MAG: hypothetical protein JXP34_20880 [Planctomycetes bacterium]|nr:hypothetical protein [Planctomycetota bacterium]